MASRASLLAFAFIATAGCDQPAEPATAAPETAALDEPAEAAAEPRVGSSVAEPAVEPPRRTVDLPVPEGAAGGLAQAGDALGEAIRAGAAAEGDTPCEAAYASAVAMVEALQAQTGQAGEGTFPDRDAYVAGCSELPAAAQQCMVLGYALEHRQECESWRTDPRVLALRDRLATGPTR